MATKLESLVVRESTETIDDRNILVALTEDQRVSFRLKGMKSGVHSILIKDLYQMLANNTVAVPKAGKTGSISVKKVSSDNEPLSLLSRLRSLNMVTPGKLELKSRLDELLRELLNDNSISV